MTIEVNFQVMIFFKSVRQCKLSLLLLLFFLEENNKLEIDIFKMMMMVEECGDCRLVSL